MQYGYSLLSIALFSLLSVNAQEKRQSPVADSTELPQVLLKGTSQTGEARKTPAAIHVLSATDLQRNGPSLLTQSFNRLPGVFTQEGALNTNRISIRGMGSRAQYGTNRLKAYLNDIPITTADGQTVLNDFDVAAIQEVEIIKGPHASIYGSGLGGVIQLTAKQPQNAGNFATASASVGSYQMHKEGVQVGHSSENTALFASYQQLQQDGYRDNANYTRKSLNLHGSLYADDTNALYFIGNFTRLKAYIPSSISKMDYQQNPTVAAANWDAAKGFESYDRFLLGLSYKHAYTENLEHITSVFVNSRDAYEPRPFDILQDNRTNYGVRSRLSYQDKWGAIPVNFNLGAEYLQEAYEATNFANRYEAFLGQGSVRGERINQQAQDRQNYNAFAQLQVALLPKLSLEAGLNLNVTRYQLTDLFLDEVNVSGDYQFDPIWSPRLAFLYDWTPNKALYLNLSKGFSVPTVDESRTPTGYLNTQLKPEVGWNYELGFKGNFGDNFYTEIALYSIQVTDLLVAQRIAEDQYVGVNAGKTDHNGAELLMQYNGQLSADILVKPYFSAEFNAYRFDEFTDEGITYDGNQLTGVPETKFNLGIDVSWRDKLQFFSNYQQVSAIPINDANTLYSDAYQLVNMRATYAFTLTNEFKVDVSVGVNNVFDEKYAVSILPNATGYGGAEPRAYYPGNDRNVYSGVAFTYQW